MSLIDLEQIKGHLENEKNMNVTIDNIRKDIEESKIPASRIVTEVDKTTGEKYDLENLIEDMYSDNVDVNRTTVHIPTVSNLKMIFSKETQGPTISGYDKNLIDINGKYEAIDFGEYTFTLSLKNKVNYIWEDNTVGVKKFNWSIDRMPVNIPDILENQLTYNGSEQSPEIIIYDEDAIITEGDVKATNVGINTVTFKLSSKNYIWEDETTGIKTSTWNIIPKQIDIPTLTNSKIQYNGEEQGPTIIYSEEDINMVGTTTGVETGVYNITFELKDANRVWSDSTTLPKTLSWSIDRIEIPNSYSTFSFNQILEYTGEEQSPTITGFNPEYCDIEGNIGIDPGTYTAIITPKKGYKWSDGTFSGKSCTWAINKKSLIIPSLTINEFIYDKEEKIPEIKNFNESYMNITGTTSASDRGNYSIEFSLIDDTRYIWNDNTTGIKTLSWIINPKIVNIPVLSETLKVYTGNQQSPIISDFDSEEISQSGVIEAVDQGTYTVIWTLTDTLNYIWEDETITVKSSTWNIAPQTITIPSLTNASKSYNGSSQGPTINNYDLNYMTQSGTTSAINAGTYTITWKLKDSNYRWSDNTSTDKSASWAIEKISGNITLSLESISLDNSTQSKTVTVTRLGTGSVTASSSDTSIATVSVSGTNVIINAIASGSVIITVNVAADTNYTAATSKTISVSCTITPTFAQETWDNISTYSNNGTADLYYDVGDMKPIVLNGKIGNYKTINNETYYVFILDINHPINGSANNNIILGGFKKNVNGGGIKDVAIIDSRYQTHTYNYCPHVKDFSMNHEYQESQSAKAGYYGTNHGGWKGTDYRYDIVGATSTAPSMYNQLKTSSNIGYDATQATINSPVADTLMAALPSDFRSKLKLWTRMIDCVGNNSSAASSIKSCVDAITLLTVTEVFSTNQIEKNVTNHGLTNGKSGTNKLYAYNTNEKNYNTRMAYYANGNSQYKWKDDGSGSNVSNSSAEKQVYALWTLCTPWVPVNGSASSSQGYDFVNVWPQSSSSNGDYSAICGSCSCSYSSNGLAPAFKI